VTTVKSSKEGMKIHNARSLASSFDTSTCLLRGADKAQYQAAVPTDLTGELEALAPGQFLDHVVGEGMRTPGRDLDLPVTCSTTASQVLPHRGDTTRRALEARKHPFQGHPQHYRSKKQTADQRAHTCQLPPKSGDLGR
jgi:hypothetical protein